MIIFVDWVVLMTEIGWLSFQLVVLCVRIIRYSYATNPVDCRNSFPEEGRKVDFALKGFGQKILMFSTFH